MRQQSFRPAFYFASFLHLVFIFLLGLMALIEWFQLPDEQEIFVFEVFDAPRQELIPAPVIEAPFLNAPVSAAVESVQSDVQPQPELSPILPVNPAPPERSPVAPVVADPPAVKPPPKVVPPKPDVVAKPTPRAEPLPVVSEPQPALTFEQFQQQHGQLVSRVQERAPAPRVDPLPNKPEPQSALTFEQFQQQHGQPAPRVQEHVPAPKPTKEPRISVPKLNVPADPSTNPKARDAAALEALSAKYKAKLKRNANLAWNRPDIADGKTYVATVLYTIAPDGRIEAADFEQRSGHAVMDTSVKAAAMSTKSPGPPPSGIREIIRISFVIQP